MKRSYLLALCSVILFSAFGWAQGPVIMKIDDESVTLSDFEKIFRKNNKDTDISQQDLDEYVELFINFKLKVREARSLGMDTVLKFINELKGYRNQLARPYLTDSDLKETLVREGYERMKTEIKASHILITLAENATPADTLAAYNKIMALRKRITGGESFKTLASGNSDDPSAAKNSGDLGYFSAFMMVYPFENAAYETPVGEISKPVRTRFGYHILNVEDKRPARGEITVAHIMIASSEEDEESLKQNAATKANEIYQKAKAGEDFGDLAKNHSDDKTSGRKGGELPSFGTGKMVAEFEDAAFSITTDGGITGPIKSPYGWHIIKRLSYKPLASYEELQNDIKTKVARDGRSQLTEQAFISRLKKEYNFSEKDRLKRVGAAVDSTIFFGEWDPRKAIKLKKKMFTLDGVQYKESDFVSYLAKNQRSEIRSMANGIPYYLQQRYNKFVESTIMEYEDKNLEKKYPEFKALMQEYNDGILLFELTDEKVWSKAVKDTAGLLAFYEQNSKQFMWETRYDVSIYSAATKLIADQALQMIGVGSADSLILAKINKDSQLNMSVQSGLFSEVDKEALTMFVLKPGLSEVKSIDDRYVFLNIRKVLEPTVKTMKEAKGLITAAYQNNLEREWIQELRNKYSVDVNREVLYSIK